MGSEHAAGGLRPHAAAHRHRDQGSDDEVVEEDEEVDVLHLQQEALSLHCSKSGCQLCP